MGIELIGLLTTVVVAHFIALVSPGPDFLLVVKSAIRSEKSKAIGVALGIAVANATYIILCLVGVGAVLATSLIIMTLLKLFGGLFLLYVAYHALKSKKSDYLFLMETAKNEANKAGYSFYREFLFGFISGISNPKNIIFYLSLFSVVLTNGIPIGVKIGLGVWMTALVFAWNTLIIYVLSQDKVKRVFAKVAFYIDKVAGLVLGAVGVKLLQKVFSDIRSLWVIRFG